MKKEHRTAIVVAVVMFILLLFVTVFRDGTAW